MDIIGRRSAQQELQRLCESPRPEFLAVYGRRRVGKTYLIRAYFNDEFSFYATGVVRTNLRTQLKLFAESLRRHGAVVADDPSDWFDAFSLLRDMLESDAVRRDPATGKRVVFIDELPWFDTPRSDFLPALDYFWNSWASMQPDLLFIVCGSATSWIVTNLLRNKGGLHSRVTARLHLEPFTLGECERYCKQNRLEWSREQIAETYLVFGGIPYYLNLLNPRLSPAQNVDRLLFARDAPLANEFEELFSSLFRNAGKHMDAIRALAGRKMGLTRDDVASATGIASGGTLTKVLEELEQCGFIRSYRTFGHKKNEMLLQLVDPFTLFWLRFVEGSSDEQFWEHGITSAGRRAWTGNAFEMLCLQHEVQIRQALGIQAIASDVCSWRSSSSDPGAQIDLVIDRADGIINLCEMKWSRREFAITKAVRDDLVRKAEAFADETGTRKSLQLTLVTPYGAKQNAYRWDIQSEVTFEDLFG